MSYGNKYKIQLDSVYLGDTYIFYIQEEDYSGAVTNLVCGSDPIRVEWHNTSNDKFGQVIVGSTLELYILADSSVTQYDDLFTSNSRKYKGVLYKNASIIWQGYGLTDNYSRPDYCKPFELVITFTDGLGLLKNDIFNENGAITGKHRLSEYIGYCLYQTDLDLKVYESINVYEENMDSGVGDSMLYQTYIDVLSFEGLTYYEILGRILIGSQVKQRNGAWWITRIDEKKARIIYYRYWNTPYSMMSADAPAGNSTEDLSITLTDVNQDAADLNVFIDRSQRIDWMGGWKNITINEDSGLNNNLIKYYKTQFTAYNTGNYNIYDTQIRLTGTGGSFDGYISYNLGTLESAGWSQKIKISIKCQMRGIIRFRLRSITETSTWYLKEKVDDIGNYVWINVDSNFIQKSYGNYNDLEEAVELDIDINTVGIIAGDCYLDIYEPIRYELLHSGTTYLIDGYLLINYADLKLELSPKATDFTDKAITNFDISEFNNIIPDDIDVYLSDTTRVSNEIYVFKNLLYYKSGDDYILTQDWIKRGSSAKYGYVATLLKEIAWQYEKEWRKRVGQLICNFDVDKVVYDDTYYYMIAGARFSPKFDLWDVTMLQISAAEEYILFEDEDIMELETGDYVKR